MTRQNRHLAGAFAAMVFVGASWGANVPVTKVMLLHFNLIPMAAIRTVAAAASLGLLDLELVLAITESHDLDKAIFGFIAGPVGAGLFVAFKHVAAELG